MAGAPMPGSLDDHIYNRLLKERIIFLGSDVRDDNANAICAQMLLLAAEAIAQAQDVLLTLRERAHEGAHACAHALAGEAKVRRQAVERKAT